MKLSKRLKNYGLWVSVSSLVILLIQQFGVEIAPEKYNTIVTTILGILVALGILNDPTTENKGFRDDNP